LYNAKDSDIDEKEIENSLNKLEHPSLTLSEANVLEGEISITELELALKQMKNNKTPGIDGFPSEFFKTFWPYLCYFILRALNYSYYIGKLPLSCRHAIITCIPKGNHNREYLKNWRPISLLSVIYKLAATVIANRLKNVLCKIISESQSGFIKGRFIGENTRFIYDLMHYTEHKQIPGLLMLIDFEKAFDSISWKFLYKTLNFFNFGPSFKKWIQLLNTDMKASVLQSGFLSDQFNIERGCKQGDPLSPYLFLLCAEILALLIKGNKSIKGITIGSLVYKIVQYADDTTLVLDGSVSDLQSAIDTLEIFESISGLKINSSKTKLIWIGKEKYSNKKLDCSLQLNWGETTFRLLGILFSVDLDIMADLNYESSLKEITRCASIWSKRKLTIFGKITVVKSIFLGKLNHLLMVLPNPNPTLLKTIESYFYKFIWDNKPDKIERTQITQSYLKGGLQMISLLPYMQSLKITWIKRLIFSSETMWLTLFNDSITYSNSLCLHGPNFLKKFKVGYLNLFWKDVFISWNNILMKYNPQNCKEYLDYPLWYNPKLSKDVFINHNMFTKGIIFVRDILDSNFQVLKLEEIKTLYSVQKLNFLEYHQIKSTVSNLLKMTSFKEVQMDKYPVFPLHIKLITKSSKFIYNTLTRADPKNIYRSKWVNELQIIINDLSWEFYFKIVHFYELPNKLAWFQFRVINRILGTNDLLYKSKIKENPFCPFCHEVQSILHCLFRCNESQKIWSLLKNWLYLTFNININISAENIILGIPDTEDSIVLNTIVIIAKYVIFMSASKNIKPSFMQIKQKIQKHIDEQILLGNEDKWQNFVMTF
jgi:hypothetical protein